MLLILLGNYLFLWRIKFIVVCYHFLKILFLEIHGFIFLNPDVSSWFSFFMFNLTLLPVWSNTFKFKLTSQFWPEFLFFLNYTYLLLLEKCFFDTIICISLMVSDGGCYLSCMFHCLELCLLKFLSPPFPHSILITISWYFFHELK